MILALALPGTPVAGSARTGVVNLAQDAPAWLDDMVSAWSTYGPPTSMLAS